jgi:hypothetical protein
MDVETISAFAQYYLGREERKLRSDLYSGDDDGMFSSDISKFGVGAKQAGL